MKTQEQAESRHKEFKAMEDSVRGYVDERLQHLGGASGPRAAQGGFYQKWRVEIWSVLILLLLAFNTFRGAGPGPETSQPPETGSVVSPPPPPPPGPPPPPPEKAREQTPAASLPALDRIRTDPDSAWGEYVTAHTEKVKAMMQSLSAETGLPPETVSRTQKGNFQSWSEKLSGNRSGINLAYVRTGLFEYAMKRWQQESSSLPGRHPINLVIEDGEYPREDISSLLEGSPWGKDFGTLPESPERNPAVQTLVVLIHLEEKQ